MQETLDINELVDYLADHDPGAAGEFLAYMEIIDLPATRRILRNLLVATAPAQESDTAADTEIDMLVIHTSGIYVLEIKNYSGWIYGDSRSKYWTQTLPQDGTIVKYQRYNPLRQNYCHTLALRQALFFFGEVPVHPMVVFGSRCQLKELRLGPNDIVVQQQDLLASILRVAKTQEDCLDAGDVNLLYDFLQPFASFSADRWKKHLETVNVKKQENHLE